MPRLDIQTLLGMHQRQPSFNSSPTKTQKLDGKYDLVIWTGSERAKIWRIQFKYWSWTLLCVLLCIFSISECLHCGDGGVVRQKCYIMQSIVKCGEVHLKYFKAWWPPAFKHRNTSKCRQGRKLQRHFISFSLHEHFPSLYYQWQYQCNNCIQFLS